MKTQRHWKPWLVERYNHVWGPAAILAPALGIYTAIVVGNMQGTDNARMPLLIAVFFTVFFRGAQFIIWLVGYYFKRELYYVILTFCSLFVIIQIVILICWVFWTDFPWTLLTVYVLFITILSMTDIFLRHEFLQYKNDELVLQGMNYLVSADSTSLNAVITPSRKWWNWSRILAFFRRGTTGPIALLGDDAALEMGAGTTPSPDRLTSPPNELAGGDDVPADDNTVFDMGAAATTASFAQQTSSASTLLGGDDTTLEMGGALASSSAQQTSSSSTLLYGDDVALEPGAASTASLSPQKSSSISLPGEDDSLEMSAPAKSSPAQHASSPGQLPAELTENVLHWSRLSSEWHTNKALWITTDSKERSGEIAQGVFDLLSPSSSDDDTGLALVDISGTRSAFWPLIRGFAVASPGFRAELGRYTPPRLDYYIRGWPTYRISGLFRRKQPDVSPLLFYDSPDIIEKLICSPLQTVYEDVKEDSGTDVENGPSSQAPRIILIVHGLQNNQQADEVYETIDLLEVKLKKHYKFVGVVVISNPKLLRHVSDDDRAIMRSPTPPTFYEHLFLLLVDGIHRTGGTRAEEMWKQLPGLANMSQEIEVFGDEPGILTLTIFAMLFNASRVRKSILELLSKLKVISRRQINRRLVKDNIKVAETLQRLLESRSYRKEIAEIPQEHAFAVLNLAHYILDRGLPENDKITDTKIFVRRAHGFLNWLSTYLKLLPEEITVHGVTLRSNHPVDHGGFGNIYRGTYKDANGEHVEVALKVLQMNGIQSEEKRQALQNKFTKEALVWHYLKHRNIVPFLGVDSSTFPSPSRAMVSLWMPGGTVLKYVAENVPSSTSAIELLCDIIQGLKYLHSANLVHGDLCARNILLDGNACARLADFGLVAFIESETTIVSTTRHGSKRWMAPELFPAHGSPFKRTAATDVWAFGCVCCEIWSGGERPFPHMQSDLGLFGEVSEGLPYPSKPFDKRGYPMPDRLWELVQWCWKRAPDQRLEVQVMVDMLSEMKKRAWSHEDEPVPSSPIASGSGTRNRGDRRPPSPSFSEDGVELMFPDPSPSHMQPNTDRKGKQRVRFEDKYAAVRFGPVEVNGDPDEIFGTIFDGLLSFVRADVLPKPLLVEEFDSTHLILRFRDVREAHSFEMTWRIYHFEPFLEASATLVEEK